MAVPQNPHPNDPWATTGREAYSPEARYVDRQIRLKKANPRILGQMIRWLLFLALVAFVYRYFTGKLQF